ncbi:MAG: aminopeptidase P family protein [Bacteroidaceae bacterium]|nr:aminopeptidase P family protein [Bacteroidaceae bacterium]
MKRVDNLRAWLSERGLSAFIFPSTDPHSGEYVPDHWKTREWISGFNGSAGIAVVTLSRAALWTDSRYWLAAEEQVQGTPFEVVRCRRNVATAEELMEWIRQEASPEGSLQVGIDGWCVPQSYVESLQAAAAAVGLTLRTDAEPASALWTDRPALPASPVEIQPLDFAGETAQSKLQRIREAMCAQGANATIITQLDDIAWTLNLRGRDVHCTPVFVAYLMLLPEATILYTDPGKLTPEVARYLADIGVRTAPYLDIVKTLRQSHERSDLRFLIDPDTTNNAIFDNVPTTRPIVLGECPVARMKTIKNEAEIRGYRSAMRKDGVAMVRFLRWLLPAVEAGGQTEVSIDQKLTALRAEQPLFRDISFDTIAGYGPHGAIVHYEATPETDVPLEPRGLLLLDSGAQYQDGTTDITRTIALGPLTDEERTDYTLVLKGHIRLAMAKFPSGSSGTQLDVLARYAMWQQGLNFLHGTGHGVGSYLSVHEGPHQIRMNYMPAPLVAGMTVTNEPGIYKAGRHGCRTENTQLITHYMDGELGEFLQFEPLTLCPIDTRPIRLEMMLPDEIQWLNQYHQHVLEELSPLLEGDDLEWLREATKPLPPHSTL